MSIHVLSPSDLFHNGISTDAGDYFESSPLAMASFITSSRTVAITVDGTAFGQNIESARIGVRVNGVNWGGVTVPADGPQTVTLILPRGTGKTVDVISSSLIKPDFKYGTYLVSCNFELSSTLVTPSFTERLVVYGDSISTGYSSEVHSLHGWTARLRSDISSVLIEGWGYRKLHDDCDDHTSRVAFAAYLVGLSPDNLWIQVGTNDYAFESWTAANFGVAYEDLLDEINALDAGLTIYCQSPTPRTTEGDLGLGDTLDDYRDAVEAATVGRAYTVFVDGTTLCTVDQVIDSGVHPTTEGHASYYLGVKAALGL